MLYQVMIQQISVSLLAHLPYTIFLVDHPIHETGEILWVDALAPITITIRLGDPADIRMLIRSRDNRHLILQIGKQPRRIVRDSKTMIQENQAHVARLDQTIVILLG